MQTVSRCVSPKAYLHPLSLDGLPRAARCHTSSINATSFWHSRIGSNEPTHPTRNPKHQQHVDTYTKLNAHSTSHKNQAHIFLHKDSCIYTLPIPGLIRTIHVVRNSKSEPNMHLTHELYKITQTLIVILLNSVYKPKFNLVTWQ